MPPTKLTTPTQVSDLDATLAIFDWAAKKGLEAWTLAQKLRPRAGAMRYRLRRLQEAVGALEEAHRYWDVAMYAARALGPLLTRETTDDVRLWESIRRALEEDRRDFIETSPT